MVVGLGASFASGAEARRPNVVLIVVDDLGYGELGCQGNAEIPTPHIDSLARDGVRFTDGYVTAPYCSPSRAGLLTGRYQTRFGSEFNPVGEQNLREDVGLPEREVTLAERLKEAGYATGLVGKWHLGGTAAFHPQRHGFDEFFGFLHEGHTYAPHFFPGLVSHLRRKEPPYDAHNPLLRQREEVNEDGYYTEALAREAVAFIERHREQPFFLYLAYNAVHSPMQATPRDFDRFRHIEDVHRRVFAAMLAALDDSVGTVLNGLKEAGLDEETLVFFLSDNGGPTAELTSSNTPLRGGKGQLYEGGIRVPFLVRWTGRVPKGRVYREPVMATDIFATAERAAGLERSKSIDGVDLLPYVTGKKTGAPHDVLFWRFGPNTAVRRGAWKLVRQGSRGETGVPFQLFHLPSDVSEGEDRSGEKPEVVADLRRVLEALDGEMVEPRWRPGR